MVKIKVKDGLICMSLAYLLDREGVYEKMLDIRKHWGLDKKLISPDKFSEWIAGYYPEMTFTKEAAQNYGELVDRWETEKSKNEAVTIEKQMNERKLAYLNKIDLEVELLMKKFGINPKYKNLITKAIVCGFVGDDDVFVGNEVFEYDFLFDSQELRLAVERSYDGSERSVKEELERDRNWLYKFRKYRGEGLSYEESIQALADYANVDNEEIEQQLKRYRRFLRGRGSRNSSL